MCIRDRHWSGYVNMFFQLQKAKEEAEEAFTNISEVSKKEVRLLIEV